ncbi:MAG TPA: ABC transporter substrate-binding protein [Alphaproteobacteria bacterium]|nr:ABC transporter substrate-binding protein [Alphaproteobacteria bacterium]
MSGKKWLAALAAVLVVGLAQAAPASAKTLKWANDGDVSSMDPYFLNETFLLGFLGNVYEPLVGRDKKLQLTPKLAVSWEQTGPTVWRFHLRHNVKFQDGTPFTADDVVFSYHRVIGEGSDLKSKLGTVAEVKKIDDYTVDFVTKTPDPLLPGEFSQWYIMSKAWCEKNGATKTANVSKNEENFATRHANGTGPFMITDREPDVRTVAVPNPHWWGKPEHNLTEVDFTVIKSDATRVAALLSGEVDMVYNVPLQDVDRINHTPHRKVLQGPEMRTIFLGMDQWRDELIDSNVKGKNPFKDVRVRRAFYQAIDENAIVKKVMRGAATPSGLMVAPSVNGWDKALNDRYPYDPAASKKLLAEAGYPNGFTVGMNCPNDRYVNDEQICQAVVAMLAKVGVKVNLLAETKSKYFAKVLARNTSFYLLGWTPDTYDSWNPLFSLIGTPDASGRGKFNLGKYSNPKVDQLITEIQSETNQKKRNAEIAEAFKIHKEEFGHIPLHQQALAWGIKDNVHLVQLPDNVFNWDWVKVD